METSPPRERRISLRYFSPPRERAPSEGRRVSGVTLTKANFAESSETLLQDVYVQTLALRAAQIETLQSKLDQTSADSLLYRSKIEKSLSRAEKLVENAEVLLQGRSLHDVVKDAQEVEQHRLVEAHNKILRNGLEMQARSATPQYQLVVKQDGLKSPEVQKEMRWIKSQNDFLQTQNEHVFHENNILLEREKVHSLTLFLLEEMNNRYTSLLKKLKDVIDSAPVRNGTAEQTVKAVLDDLGEAKSTCKKAKTLLQDVQLLPENGTVLENLRSLNFFEEDTVLRFEAEFPAITSEVTEQPIGLSSSASTPRLYRTSTSPLPGGDSRKSPLAQLIVQSARNSPKGQGPSDFTPSPKGSSSQGEGAKVAQEQQTTRKSPTPMLGAFAPAGRKSFGPGTNSNDSAKNVWKPRPMIPAAASISPAAQVTTPSTSRSPSFVGSGEGFRSSARASDAIAKRIAALQANKEGAGDDKDIPEEQQNADEDNRLQLRGVTPSPLNITPISGPRPSSFTPVASSAPPPPPAWGATSTGSSPPPPPPPPPPGAISPLKTTASPLKTVVPPVTVLTRPSISPVHPTAQRAPTPTSVAPAAPAALASTSVTPVQVAAPPRPMSPKVASLGSSTVTTPVPSTVTTPVQQQQPTQQRTPLSKQGEQETLSKPPGSPAAKEQEIPSKPPGSPAAKTMSAQPVPPASPVVSSIQRATAGSPVPSTTSLAESKSTSIGRTASVAVTPVQSTTTTMSSTQLPPNMSLSPAAQRPAPASPKPTTTTSASEPPTTPKVQSLSPTSPSLTQSQALQQQQPVSSPKAAPVVEPAKPVSVASVTSTPASPPPAMNLSPSASSTPATASMKPEQAPMSPPTQSLGPTASSTKESASVPSAAQPPKEKEKKKKKGLKALFSRKKSSKG